MLEQIGEHAGSIWEHLSTNGKMSVSAIKKSTELKEKDVLMGLGWLAREDKLNIEQKGNQLHISLK